MWDTVDGGELALARRSARLSQSELARRIGTSRETISAYEHDRKSPTLDTLNRLLSALDQELAVCPRIRFRALATGRGRMFVVPDVLPRLPVERAMARVRLPLHLDWSPGPRTYDFSDRRQRALAYEIVLREGQGKDIREYVDGALLLDLWPDLVLPRDIRHAWQSVIDNAREAA